MFKIERHGNEIVVKGKGSGHGVGLNQMGALHLAKENEWSYQEILDFYYPATKICQRRYAHDDNVEFSCAI
jgi:stage II sporulation protein D